MTTQEISRIWDEIRNGFIFHEVLKLVLNKVLDHDSLEYLYHPSEQKVWLIITCIIPW